MNRRGASSPLKESGKPEFCLCALHDRQWKAAHRIQVVVVWPVTGGKNRDLQEKGHKNPDT